MEAIGNVRLQSTNTERILFSDNAIDIEFAKNVKMENLSSSLNVGDKKVPMDIMFSRLHANQRNRLKEFVSQIETMTKTERRDGLRNAAFMKDK